MKITYLGHFSNTESDATEKHIQFALENLGHQVVPIDEKEFTSTDVIDSCRDSDLFLFHKGAVQDNYSFHRLMEILNGVSCKKVFWYFDKVWGQREHILQTIIPFTDYGFLTDESWLKRRKFSNCFPLRQGIGNEHTEPGEYRDEYAFDVVFLGSEAPYREKFLSSLKTKYGENFKHFTNIFNRDLYDLCESAKVIVSPIEPQDDFYWSSRIYMTLGSGGFLVHPLLEGLKNEFKDKKHFVGYKGYQDMFEKIDTYLKKPKMRDKIRKEGYEHCLKNYTYQHRVEDMLAKICGT